MQHAFEELFRCAQSGQGVGILTAAAGTGKTLLCRKLIGELRKSFATVFLANSNFLTRRSLLQSILYELDHPYIHMAEQELRLELMTAVKAIRNQKQAVVLIVDEAHLLDERLLEELRTITNLVEESEPLVRVLLSGQLLLDEKLANRALEALNQRIRCQVTLEPLTRDESVDYIAQRLKWAGADVSSILTADALQLICYASDGLPRCLNQLCDHSLLLGYVAEEKPVGEVIVRKALDDLKQLPLHWNVPATVQSSVEQLAAEEWTTRSDDHQDLDSEMISTGEPLNSPGCIEVGASDDTINDDDSHEGFYNQPYEDDYEPEEFEPTVVEFGVPDGDEWNSPEESDEITDHQSDVSVGSDLKFAADKTLFQGETDFDEELIVDLYANLDAGLQVSEESNPGNWTFDSPEGLPSEKRPPAPKTIAEPDGAPSDEADLDRFDASTILSEIDEAHNSTTGFDGQSQLSGDVLCGEQLDLEGQIGSDLLKTCRDIQQTLTESMREADVDFLENNLESPPELDLSSSTERQSHPIEFDVVQPETDELQATESTSDRIQVDWSEAVNEPRPQRPYAQLFSKLRRQQS